MAAQVEHEIVLYDLACTKNVCFSPVVWRIRLMLNYKRIPYKTIFLEFPDIEPTLKGLGVVPNISNSKHEYTVPTIQHIPSDTYLMDSIAIAKFLETRYPNPTVPLTSDLGREIESKARGAAVKAFSKALVGREMNILSSRSQEYFRRTREALFGVRLEDMIEPEQEEQNWKEADEGMVVVSDLIQTNKADGPFVLGARPSYTDFFIAGSLQSARVVDEGLFQRHMKYPGYKQVYEACVPYMEKKD